jgi:hypothetical protein
MNNRRKLLVVLGTGALAASFGSFAQQQGKVWRVVFLALRRSASRLEADSYGAFPAGMRELGYVEGKNLVIEWRSADKVLPVEVRNPAEVEPAFATMTREGAGAFIVASDGLFGQEAHRIAQLAEKHRMPSSYTVPQFVEAGGLMSYGQNVAENFRRAAAYVDKIFKGARPGDLPIEQAARFELVVNMKTAKALGIKIPNSILVQATRVIE